ncbi:MAG: DUF1385 domain-containing protein [Deltaproteobacteria bacterium]|nr:DUF1385 domain-containing protein [Deltaproteobacteria bacterium]
MPLFSRKTRLLFASALVSTTKPVIGGQAVVEGVMMRSPKSFAVAVRTPDGGITVREEAWLSFAERFPILKLPILRGATMLVESMYNGMQALSFSAATAFPEDKEAQQEQAKLETQKKEGGAGLFATIGLSMLFAFGLFKGVPHLSAWGLGQAFGTDGVSALPMTGPLFHAVDGGIKLMLFIGYILLISQMKEVKRLFMYHGAEHKSVHVWEANEPLDVDHARPKTTAHPRCGTSLLLLSIVTSFLVFVAVLPFVPVVFENSFAQAMLLLLIKMPLLLPIAGVAYEVQRLAARHPNNPLVRALISPGMLMQRLTTAEPGDAELEVALTALRKTAWREQQQLVKAREAVVETFPSFADANDKLPLAA